MVELRFVAGTLELRGLEKSDPRVPGSFRWDERAGLHRAPALEYAPALRALHRARVKVDDRARAYVELASGALARREPRPFQAEALTAWKKNQHRGVVVLPTGAGKSHVAVMAIDDRRRSALVVAPTLDLVQQWYDLLRTTFAREIGVVGGGDHRVLDLTVTTYDSAFLHMEHLGARFGLVVFDECHHLPSESYALASRFCLAPFRLGLTATPERQDGREDALAALIGPEVYRRDIVEMSGAYLADYETVRIAVELSPDEREEYERDRRVYLSFVRAQGIRLGTPAAWTEFIRRAAVSAGGREAFAAYRRQRELALCAPAKLGYVDMLLHDHRRDRSIVFTQDNATAYAISKRFLIPAITHQTKVTERSRILEGLATGSFRAVVTSKVLNEGVDVPDANVAIVVSGSGSVREHVQRLGRVLRKKGQKRARLYELVTAGTGETFTSERRREHSAYR